MGASTGPETPEAGTSRGRVACWLEPPVCPRLAQAFLLSEHRYGPMIPVDGAAASGYNS
jgi:hypothetical protein